MNCPKCESKFLSKIDNDNYICEDCRNKFTEEFIAMVNQRRFMHEQLEKMSEQKSAYNLYTNSYKTGIQ